MKISAYADSQMRMRKQILLSIFSFMLFLVAGHACGQSKSLKYNLNSEGGWIPYGPTGDKANSGIFQELTPLIMSTAEIDVEAVDVPTQRAIASLTHGGLDFDYVSPDWFENGNVGIEFVASEPVFVITEYFITLPKNAKRYQVLEDVHDKIVGTIRGYYYFDDKNFIRMDFDKEANLVKGLELERFEVAILEEMTAHYWSKHAGIQIALASVHTLGEMVIRLRNEHAALLLKLNRVINRLRKDGQIDAIFDKYRNGNFIADLAGKPKLIKK